MKKSETIPKVMGVIHSRPNNPSIHMDTQNCNTEYHMRQKPDRLMSWKRRGIATNKTNITAPNDKIDNTPMVNIINNGQLTHSVTPIIITAMPMQNQ